MPPVLRRAGACLASAVIAVSGVTLITSPAEAAVTDPRPVTIAADWIAGQLTNGLIHNDQYDFDDVGLSIDTGFGLAAVGGHDSTVAAIAAAVGPKVTSGYAQDNEYAFDPPYDFVQVGYYGAQAAKALVFAQVTDQDTATWAGTDLVTAVEDRIASAPVSGRLTSDSSYGDYTNTLGQAFAARGLTATSSDKAADATTFLLRQQCSAGYFRLALTDQTCDADSSGADTDATAVAVNQLAAVASPTPAVTAALAAAKTWLQGAQLADGSFGSSAPTTAPNSNSTGLAGAALGTLGDTVAARNAAIWVRQHQADELTGCPDALSTETGAIAYDSAALGTGRSAGITTATQDQWRRTTAPTLPVLTYAPSARPSLDLTGPTAYVKAGSIVIYSITGVVPGDKVCVAGLSLKKTVTAAATGKARVAFTMPSGTGHRTISVADRDGNSASVVTDILGPKKLTVTVQNQIKRGGVVPVTVSGLAPGEHVKITWRGVTVRTGYANIHGVFSTSFGVGQTLGYGAVSAFGKYADIRRGYDVLKVVS